MTNSNVCPTCQGEGRAVVRENRVTPDMASDAGEPSMTGMHHSYDAEECIDCNGTGRTNLTPSQRARVKQWEGNPAYLDVLPTNLDKELEGLEQLMGHMGLSFAHRKSLLGYYRSSLIAYTAALTAAVPEIKHLKVPYSLVELQVAYENGFHAALTQTLEAQSKVAKSWGVK